ncbi:MAG: hypothetical protein JXR83_15915 [Deltaproteobacteria bacterium]|nr:hypothetical protein [Deltaproteobacteria bacterium]
MKKPSWIIALAIGCTTAIGVSNAALAADKKKGERDEAADFLNALTGSTDSKGSSGMSDLKDATRNVGPASQAASEDLKVKISEVKGDGKVKVIGAFASKSIIVQNHKCVARAPRVEFFEAPEFPFHADKFNICTELEGGAGRAMKMSVQITTGRGKIIGRAENEIADFTGKTRLDHIIDFQPLTFPEAGTYRLIVDIEGERVANIPLFDVRPPKGAE